MLPVNKNVERLAEIAAIADADIDTSDIPEASEAEFRRTTLRMPQDGNEAYRREKHDDS